MIKFMCCGKASRCNLFLAPRLFLIWGWVVSLVQGQLIIILAHTTCYLICISNSPQGYESDWLSCQLDFLYMSPSVKRLREDDDNAASEKRLSFMHLVLCLQDSMMISYYLVETTVTIRCKRWVITHGVWF